MTPTEQAAAAVMQGLVLSFTKATMAAPENSGAIPMINAAGRTVAHIYPDENGDYHHANIFCDRLCRPEMVLISAADLAILKSAAESYRDDLSSGLEDGTYEEGADTLEDLERVLDGPDAVEETAPAPAPADEVEIGTMGRLVRADDHEVGIVATLETVLGSCGANAAYRQPDGSLVVEYDGSGTDVNWDSQETVTRRGQMVFIDEEGNEVTADQVVLLKA